ncbi:MAG: molybdopterin molybdotransferase MoeA, partial [Gemmatimonadota bacterium]|nr:molybdopterin molybdotransferase MoeA [Gemmatimonadota bacterium]
PRTLHVNGETVAGAPAAAPLPGGQAVKIMTGAPVPDGADTVIRVEDTDAGTDRVEIRADRDRLRNVRPLGEDFRDGDLLLAAGSRVTSAAIGVLASAGIAKVETYRSPTVAIVASGDELVRVEQFSEVLDGRRIVSSNSYSLVALVREAGGLPRDGGLIPDDPRALSDAISAIMPCDLILTSGGVSVGERDFTRSVMTAMGAEIGFWRTRIRPGGPLAFATLDGRPWIALPGNPVSAMVTFELFVRPALLRMRGESKVYTQCVPVTLDEDITVSGDLTHYLRVIVEARGDAFHARLTGSQSSAVLTSMMRANALLIVPEGRPNHKAGDTLRAVPLGDSLSRTGIFPA